MFLKVLSCFLLLFNGIGALYGSIHFITDPTGKSLGMSVSLLEHSPFGSYLIPGIILFFANGIQSFAVFILLFLKAKIFPLAVIAQGCVLLGWLIVQVVMLQTIAWLHIVLGLVAGLMMISGLLLRSKF